MSSVFFYTSLTLYVIICIFLILLVLIQKGRGGGLSGAFGGSGGNTAFGTKTGDVLTWATSIVFGVFILLAIALNLMCNARAAKAAKAEEDAKSPQTLVTPADLNPSHLS